MPMAGGHSDQKEVTAEVRDELASFKAAVEAKAGKQFATFEPVAYTQQVVAGMIYYVKY
eukprot:CAMPEP_0168615812 /NCGR_PEP_ID=MMETSP0449_2-20121227/4698_1 /TAXON_ID=1082188 /ORGANISM="Strombidium rassoulzadegani, Strain ras09" /LENGTH=58 /DNA_ID=CAMNT_0008656565 /DNA_START=34 /DNA_END=210 /DNA_ORIENTATION=-